MVYFEENKATCRILDQHPNTSQKKLTFLVSPTKTVQDFLEQVSTQFSYDKFELILEATNLNLKDHLNENLSNIGIELKKQNILTLVPPGEKAKIVVPKSENIAPKMITNDEDKPSIEKEPIKKKSVVKSPSKVKSAASKADGVEKVAKKAESGEEVANKTEDGNKIASKEKITEKTSIKSDNEEKVVIKKKSTVITAKKSESSLKTSSKPQGPVTAVKKSEDIESTSSKSKSIEIPSSKSNSIEITSSKSQSPESTPSKSQTVNTTPTKPEPTETTPTKPQSIDVAPSKPQTIEITPSNTQSLAIEPNKQQTLDIETDKKKCIAVETELSSDDDLALGASASPTEEPSSSPPALPALFDSPPEKTTSFRRCNDSPAKSSFVGLVNQAMTCYLNSLLQALYMTPEFRNALYNWESDGTAETKSIPFQLQKLFVNLQTSGKLAVETTDLTKSFGWDSTEAWQQHDIQELCRVMFDALEQKFKNTKQADLINCLYQGKMIDYVKCLECETEKSREDMFLDIPLPVRPFGSTVAYESVEEAIKAFVQPETLDGNNQYFCEKCDKKCDAHKGLKFKKFPYILTLHLKRFDFDYQTLHRIKLNDKVTFPHQLNLNSFVPTEQKTWETVVKSDDCSTTDSVLDEEGSIRHFNQNSNGFPETQEDDEGIDMSVNGDSKSVMSNSTSTDSSNNTGPYLYDLFAIMIHSGSASGGHYYAYIKDMETGFWYSFNDQTVSPITTEDINKSFGGGGAFKSYYSGFTSSTNAYMLMYRQMDPTRNCLAIKEENFPPHIKSLVERIKNHEKETTRITTETMKLKIYFKNPLTKVKTDTKVFVINESTLAEVLEDAYSKLKVKSLAPIERCRLVAYDSPSDGVERSFEGLEDEEIGNIMPKLQNQLELLLEVREASKEFEVYKLGGITTKVFELKDGDIDGPMEVRAYEYKPVSVFKDAIAKKFYLKEGSPMILAVKKYNEKPHILSDEATVKSESIYNGNKIFMTRDTDVEKFKKSVEAMDGILTLYFALPNSKKETLEKLSIPSYEPESVDMVDSVAFNIVGTGECNSEDSSLSSNSDRTLVDEPRVDDEPDYFFKAVQPPPMFEVSEGDEDTTDSESQRILKVLADRRMTVGKLKQKLQPFVKIPMEYFKIFHVLAAQTENECTQLTSTLNLAFKDEERLVIELGRALRKGEFKVKLYHLNVAELTDMEKLPFVCDYILRECAEVGQTKREIIAHMKALDKEKYAHLTYERTRLRKKSWKSPAQIYMDDQKFGDDYIIKVSASPDIIIQELPSDEANQVDFDGEPLNDDSKSLFVRRFHPSKMEFGKWDEIMIGKFSELKGILAKISGIEEENIMYTKLVRSFANTSITAMDTLNWFDSPATMEDNHTLSGTPDGSVYLYKDKTEPAKKLTAEERLEISKKENAVSSTTSTYSSPRRERGLKIYLDSPKKRDDS